MLSKNKDAGRERERDRSNGEEKSEIESLINREKFRNIERKARKKFVRETERKVTEKERNLEKGRTSERKGGWEIRSEGDSNKE